MTRSYIWLLYKAYLRSDGTIRSTDAALDFLQGLKDRMECSDYLSEIWKPVDTTIEFIKEYRNEFRTKPERN